MNWETVKGDWKQFKGSARERWGKLTNDQVEQAAGDREQLEGAIQKAYAIDKQNAKKQVDEWVASLRN